MIKKFFIALLFLLVCIWSVNFLIKKNAQVDTTPEVKIAGVTLHVDLATTPQAQEQGLSGRTALKDTEGMLFVFDYPGRYSFWMKDMKFPIDMIWLDQNMKVVYIKKNATPASYPSSFTPTQDATYVLEVISGFSDVHSLKEGDAAVFINIPK